MLIVQNPSNAPIQETAGSNGSSTSMPSIAPSSNPVINPSVFPPQVVLANPILELESAPTIFENNFIKILPTQTYVNLDSSLRDGYPVYNLTNRSTTYVCPQIVQMYSASGILAKDIPSSEFSDDIKALIMFRGLEVSEKVIGQTYSGYKSFGVALNDESFEPYRSVTRAEFVKMLVRALSCRYTFMGTYTDFSDISEDMWYAEYIAFAVKNGWIQ